MRSGESQKNSRAHECHGPAEVGSTEGRVVGNALGHWLKDGGGVKNSYL